MYVASIGLRIFGLPTHPLIVHAAVVLVPLSAAAFVGLTWRERWRELYLLPITLLAMGGAVATFLVGSPGTELEFAL